MKPFQPVLKALPIAYGDAGGEHGGLMGGGIDDAFVGGIPFDGRGGHHGPFGGPFGGGLGCNGAFDAASGRVVCTAVTRNGITVKRSAQYKDAAGAVQQAFDTLTTNSVNTQSATTGTIWMPVDPVPSIGPTGDPGKCRALRADPPGAFHLPFDR